MIPLRDESRRPQGFPIVTAAIVGLNLLAFFAELGSGDAIVDRWSVVPAEIMAGNNLITLVTAQFLHAGWVHILGNMVFLWAFGPQIEDAMNPARYAFFYLVGGAVAMLAQCVADPASTVPTLGASGAIAAVMGAFLVTYPRDRIRTVLIIGFFVRITFLPAAFLIGFWFLLQLFEFGIVADVQAGGVAYLAHIGGIIFGAVAARLFEDPRRLARQPDVDGF